MDDFSALSLADEQDKDICVERDDEAKLVQVSDKEIIETLNDALNGLQIECALFFIIFPAWSLNGQIDVFKHWEQNLA